MQDGSREAALCAPRESGRSSSGHGRVGLRAVAIVLAALLAAASSYAWRPASSGDKATVRDSSAIDGVGASPSPDEVARLITVFEVRVKDHTDALDYRFLGGLYLQRARAFGDVADYARARAALERAIELRPADLETRTSIATLHYTTHDFAGALDLAQALLAEDPSRLSAVAIIGDARLELGDYDGAATSYEALAEQAPNVAAVDARLARLAFLRGRPDQARDFAGRAFLEAAAEGAFGAGLAWYAHLEAQIAFDRGDYGAAAAHEEQALAAAPAYHVSLASLARARAAQGRATEAIALYEKAIAVSPQPDYLSALGDLRSLAGDETRARTEYAAVEAIATLASGQQLYDRQLALFYADHDMNAARAVAIARSSLERRGDVYGHDAYAWSLYKTGAFADARASADRALAQGTTDAKLWYHSGMISLALGDTGRARRELQRVLDTSPNFDPLQAPRARGALESLAGR